MIALFDRNKRAEDIFGAAFLSAVPPDQIAAVVIEPMNVADEDAVVRAIAACERALSRSVLRVTRSAPR